MDLSFQQESLLLINAGSSNQGRAYNLVFKLDVSGSCRKEDLFRAWREVLTIHKPLRARYSTQDQLHVIDYIEPVALDSTTDFQDLNRDATEVEHDFLEDLISREAERNFLATDSAMAKLTLVKLKDDNWIILMSFHHTAIDGWSFSLVLQQLAERYNQALQGLQPAAVEDNSYAVYAARQPEVLSSPEAVKAMRFWCEPLQELVDYNQLPKATPASHDHLAETYVAPFIVEDAGRVARFCDAHNTTPFVFFHSTFALLVGRLSNQTNAVIGSPFANRSDPEFFETVGLFANLLPIVVPLKNNIPFVEFLSASHKVVCDALVHDYLPFQKIVEQVAPIRIPHQNPLFQTVFAYETLEDEMPAFDGMEYTIDPLRARFTKFDLSLHVQNNAGNHMVEWIFDSALFSRADIVALSRRLENLIDQVIKDPNLPILDADLMLDCESRTIPTMTYQRNLPTMAPEISLYSAFLDNVRLRPHAQAILGAVTISYGELNQAVGNAASNLAAAGLKPGDNLALRLQRSEAFIICALAALSLGAVFVPVDVEWPERRFAQILDDAEVTLVVSQHKLPNYAASVAIEDILKQATSCAPEHQYRRGDLCVMFTSGTSGQPKMVRLSERGVSLFFNHLVVEHDLGLSDVVLFKSSIGFDVSLMEFLLPLTIGAAVCLHEHDSSVDWYKLATLLSRNQVTLAQFTPALLRELIRLPAWKDITTLRTVICGGDILTPSLIKAWHDSKCNVNLYNYYGPTEASIGCACWPVKPLAPGIAPPIGRAIAGAILTVVNPAGQVQPPGFCGELCIEGDLVSPSILGGRYLTGDLVRWDPILESLVFQGRKDRQLKLRGQRVDLYEIEDTALLSGLVSSVCCIFIDEGASRQFITLYYVPKAHVLLNEESLEEQLRRHIAASVPAYMIPAAFQKILSLPLTLNGKIDERALPAFQKDPLLHRPPRTPTEKECLRLTGLILSAESLSMSDNFFEIGGTSLSAFWLVEAIRNSFGLQAFPINAVYEADCLRSLSQLVDTYSTAQPEAPPARPKTAAALWRVATPKQAFEFGFRLENPQALDSIEFGFKINLPSATATASVQKLLRKHKALRTCLFIEEDEVRVEYVDPEQIFEVRSIKVKQKEDRASWAKIVEQRKPLCKVVLYESDGNVLFVRMCIDHIVVDGHSLDLIRKEFGRPFAIDEVAEYDFYEEYRERMLVLPQRLVESYWQSSLAVVRDALVPVNISRTTMQESALEVDIRAFRAIAGKRHVSPYVLFVGLIQIAFNQVLGNLFVYELSLSLRQSSNDRYRVGPYHQNYICPHLFDDNDYVASLALLQTTLNKIYKYWNYPLHQALKTLNVKNPRCLISMNESIAAIQSEEQPGSIKYYGDDASHSRDVAAYFYAVEPNLYKIEIESQTSAISRQHFAHIIDIIKNTIATLQKDLDI